MRRGLGQHTKNRLGVVGEASKEEPVDVAAQIGQQPRSGASAVDDREVLYVFSERDPDALADIGDVAGGRGLGCADGSAWLVGDDHPGCRRIADVVRQRGKHLADAHVGGCSGVGAGGLSHAETWDEAIAKRCADLRGWQISITCRLDGEANTSPQTAPSARPTPTTPAKAG
jgi:hypothetical protein